MQLTWTALLQGFKNSPIIFGNQLTKELESWKKEILDRNLLQHRLYTASNQDWKGVSQCYYESQQNFLGQSGYRMSKKKAQAEKEALIYLGFESLQGKRGLGFGEKLKRSHLPDSGAQEFKRSVSLLQYGQTVSIIDCQLWGTGKTLVWSSTKKYLVWTPESQRAFRALKRALMGKASALKSLCFETPRLKQTFWAILHERTHLALGLLAQYLGSWKQPVGYFSRQLDNASKAWLWCLRAVAAAVF